jgi:hypothetical protein
VGGGGNQPERERPRDRRASSAGSDLESVGESKFKKVEEWLIRRPAPGDVQAWAAQRSHSMGAGAEALRAAAASVEAVLCLAQTQLDQATLSLSHDRAAQ